MKTLISLILTAFIFVTSAPQAFAEQHHGAVAEQGYECPMHPEVKGAKGDTCPKCGMNLEQAKAKQAGKACDNCPKHKHQMAKQSHHCPMHPEVKGAKGDSCPKCGMFLEPVASADSAHKHH